MEFSSVQFYSVENLWGFGFLGFRFVRAVRLKLQLREALVKLCSFDV